MSWYNVRASFNKLIQANADPGVPVLFEEDEPWLDTCYRVEWIEGEVPRNVTQFTRICRVHIRDTSTASVEQRADRLISAVGLGHNWSLTTATEYDYTNFPAGDPPPVTGTYLIERSPRGVDTVTPTVKEPTIRHRVINLVLVYDYD